MRRFEREPRRRTRPPRRRCQLVHETVSPSRRARTGTPARAQRSRSAPPRRAVENGDHELWRASSRARTATAVTGRAAPARLPPRREPHVHQRADVLSSSGSRSASHPETHESRRAAGGAVAGRGRGEPPAATAGRNAQLVDDIACGCACGCIPTAEGLGQRSRRAAPSSRRTRFTRPRPRLGRLNSDGIMCSDVRRRRSTGNEARRRYDRGAGPREREIMEGCSHP